VQGHHDARARGEPAHGRGRLRADPVEPVEMDHVRPHRVERAPQTGHPGLAVAAQHGEAVVGPGAEHEVLAQRLECAGGGARPLETRGRHKEARGGVGAGVHCAGEVAR
jgi:hypothetical protein